MSEPKTLVVNVDDLEAQRYVKRRALEESGFEVVDATTGAEALRLIEQNAPPVVLLDVQLPDISGYDVCAFIKKKWPEVMVLMTSATFTTSLHRTAGLDSGADGYLVQPAEQLELAAAINSLLRIRRAEDELRSLNKSLEERVQARTADLAETNAKLRSEIAQRQKAEAALVQSQKMEAVGQLTGGLAHDFNNLLTAVVGSLDLIRARATDQRVVRLSENALRAAERGSKLTGQLLAFSRSQKLATAPTNINALIEGMSDLFLQSLGANISVQTKLAPGLPIAMADANQLELALLNLALNARDAMPEGGTLTITTDFENGNVNAVVIRVTDTGTGMPPEVVARAFDPFFTTKPPGKGTGLGLAQVYGIVQQLGGEISIQTEVGKGTTFRIALRSTERACPAPGETEHSTRGRHFETLLVVDDDADVREVMTGVLRDIGYSIHEASNGALALEMLDNVNPSLLVIDFAMPGMNGAEVAIAARQRNPEQRILFVSGFADSTAVERAVGRAPVLRKPFRPIELAEAVRTALDP